MSKTSAIVLVIDRLGIGPLGPYGSPWCSTPQFNRLAAQAVLVQQAIVDSVQLETIYRSYWTGRHAACVDTELAPLHLAHLCRAAGIETKFVTDTRSLTEHPLLEPFDQAVLLNDVVRGVAGELAEAKAVKFVDELLSELPSSETRFCLWAHSGQLSMAWDAPMCLREELAAAEEVEPYGSSQIPNWDVRSQAHDQVDPDEMWSLVLAYAAEVSVWDHALGNLLDALETDRRLGETLLIVTAPRGFPLGEHQVLGPVNSPLYTELIQVPYLVRYPAGHHASIRLAEFWQPPMLLDDLAEWMSLMPDGGGAMTSWKSPLRSLTSPPLRASGLSPTPSLESALCVNGQETAFRTHDWFLRCQPAESKGGAATYELYAKPDDVWDANEVSDRCREDLEKLIAALPSGMF